MDRPLRLEGNQPDWLLVPPPQTAKVLLDADGGAVVLENAWVRRRLRLAPAAATVSLERRCTGREFLRSTGPEAILRIDGAEHAIGGLTGAPDPAYLASCPESELQPIPGAFRLVRHRAVPVQAPFAWKRTSGDADLPWPPAGAGLQLSFVAAAGPLQGLEVDIHYEIYDAIPVIAKWIVVRNNCRRPLCIERFVSERLALAENESFVEESSIWRPPDVDLFTDYTFNGMAGRNANQAVAWEPDPAYDTQVNYERKTPCLLVARPPHGPSVTLAPGERWTSFRSFVLPQDSTDRERRGLSMRRAYRTLAPWIADNPLMLHVTSTNPEVVRRAIDQCAETGFEMVILSFGSGLNMEDISEANIAKFKTLADYAHAKGIRFGGYSLLASRRISDEHDVVDPETGKIGKAIFGNSPCLGSAWADDYFHRIRTFLLRTGFDVLEHDGSYPGDRCGSRNHPGHEGAADSQWRQHQRIAGLYQWCRGRGIFLNVPDWYFLNGSNKVGMGYRETNWSLPRERQHIHARQNLYDGTWEKTPSMGWMFVPLVEYHGGGPAATIEPLDTHRDDYGRHLANCLGYGAQACYRGPRVYDTERTRDMVRGWIQWYKRYRPLLESDVLHLRRPDGRRIDGVLHVNPRLPEKGLACLWNPTEKPLRQSVSLPLAYTGLRGSATVRVGDGRPRRVSADAEGCVTVEISFPAQGMSWVVLS